MNKFELYFFKRHIPNGSYVQYIAHRHILVILKTIILNYLFWVILPSFLYYYIPFIQNHIPFFILEIFIILVYIKNLYNIVNWYSDVWIITDNEVVLLEWQIFSTYTTTVSYNSIEWLNYEQLGVIKKIFGIWDIIIHKIWWGDSFFLKDATRASEIIAIVDEIRKKNIEFRYGYTNNNSEDLKELIWTLKEYVEESKHSKTKPEAIEEKRSEYRNTKWTINLE